MLDESEGLGTGGTFFLFTWFSVQCLLFVLFLCPETKGLTLEQIDALFLDAEGWRTIARWPEYVEVAGQILQNALFSVINCGKSEAPSKSGTTAMAGRKAGRWSQVGDDDREEDNNDDDEDDNDDDDGSGGRRARTSPRSHSGSGSGSPVVPLQLELQSVSLEDNDTGTDRGGGECSGGEDALALTAGSNPTTTNATSVELV